jgi:hypothetical protein
MADALKVIETDTIQFYYKNGILFLLIKDGAEFTLESTRRDQAEIRKVFGNKRVPVLIDASNHYFITREGLEYSYKKEAYSNRQAVAFYTSNFSSRLKARFFISNHKPLAPTELFSNKTEAINWLNEFLV